MLHKLKKMLLSNMTKFLVLVCICFFVVCFLFICFFFYLWEHTPVAPTQYGYTTWSDIGAYPQMKSCRCLCFLSLLLILTWYLWNTVLFVNALIQLLIVWPLSDTQIHDQSDTNLKPVLLIEYLRLPVWVNNNNKKLIYDKFQ